jgi:hypothetical protein
LLRATGCKHFSEVEVAELMWRYSDILNLVLLLVHDHLLL